MDSDKTLKREDEMTDLSKMPSSDVPKDSNTGLFGRVTGTLSQGFDKVKGLVSSHKETTEQKVEEKITEVKEVVNEWEQPLGSIHRPVVEKSEPEAASESHTLGERLREGISGLTSQITHQVDNLKDRLRTKEEVSEDTGAPGQSFTGKIKDGFDMISNKISSKFEKEEPKEDPSGFKTVEEGFSETVDELKKEQHGDEKYVSQNPFDSLDSQETSDETKKSITERLGGDITNKVQQLKDGISNTTSKLSEKFTETKEKLKSSLASAPVDKENTVTADRENLPQTA